MGAQGRRPEAEVEAIRAEIQAACVRGLADAGAALLGDDPGAVCTGLAAWHLANARPLPRLAGMCWAALEPLQAAPPVTRAAIDVERLLVGTPLEPAIAVGAVAALRSDGGQRDRWRPIKQGADLVADLSRRALATAVEELWAELARAAATVGAAARADDRRGAVAAVTAARSAVAPIAERIEILANRVVGAVPAPQDRRDATRVPAMLAEVTDIGLLATAAPLVGGTTAPRVPAGPDAPAPTAPVPAEATVVEPPAEGPITPAVSGATAPLPPLPAPSASSRGARSRTPGVVITPAPRARGSAAPRPEDVEWRTVREHRYTPMIFLLLAVGMAALVLLTVLRHTPAGG
jgi:hypothetical protein